MAMGLFLMLEIIFTIFTVPTGHPLKEKYDLLKKLKKNLDFPLSTQILDMLEHLEEMEHRRHIKISDNMKEAYLQVAVQLTRDIVTSRCDNMEAIGKIADIWGHRMQHLKTDEATSEARLGSKRLRAWFDKINNVFLSFTIDDAENNEIVKSYFDDVHVRDSLVNYLYEEACAIREEVSFITTIETSRDNVTRNTVDEDDAARTSFGRKSRRRASVQSLNIEGTSETPGNDNVTPRRGRRGYEWWEPDEEEALRDGVKEFGPSNWSAILKKNQNAFKHFRTNVDLKDKWKTMRGNKRKHTPIGFNATR